MHTAKIGCCFRGRPADLYSLRPAPAADNRGKHIGATQRGAEKRRGLRRYGARCSVTSRTNSATDDTESFWKMWLRCNSTVRKLIPNVRAIDLLD
jgi:hypothetical protein